MHAGKLTVGWICLCSEPNRANVMATLSTPVNTCYITLLILHQNAQVWTWPKNLRMKEDSESLHFNSTCMCGQPVLC